MDSILQFCYEYSPTSPSTFKAVDAVLDLVFHQHVCLIRELNSPTIRAHRFNKLTDNLDRLREFLEAVLVICRFLCSANLLKTGFILKAWVIILTEITSRLSRKSHLSHEIRLLPLQRDQLAKVSWLHLEIEYEIFLIAPLNSIF
jgi:hypothetical protein